MAAAGVTLARFRGRRALHTSSSPCALPATASTESPPAGQVEKGDKDRQARKVSEGIAVVWHVCSGVRQPVGGQDQLGSYPHMHQ